MDYLSQFEELKAQKLNLDLTRGKPAEDQLDLSSSLESLKVDEYGSDGIDIRNYGQLKGLSECRELGSMILGCNKEYIWAGGNSSLTLMSQFLTYLCIQGNGDGPWSAEERASILCPVPGYDRHFILSENLGLNMIPVPLGGSGPKLDVVRSYVESDSSIRGIWCVPKHSNPTGETFDKETIEGLIEIFSNTKKKSMIFWDNEFKLRNCSVTMLKSNITSPSKIKAKERIDLKQSTYKKLKFLYEKMLVPESEQSRNTGAGAGTTDND